MRVTDMLANISTDLTSIGLIRYNDFELRYFCTPKNAVVFAGIGVDGIHFCIIPDENDLTLEYSSVYVVSPMMPDHYVEIVAENFYDFLSLVIAVKDAGALECISYFGREKFLEYLQDIDTTYDKIKFKEASLALSNEFHIKKIDDVYSYVKQLQEKTDLTEIQYTEEYYELLAE